MLIQAHTLVRSQDPNADDSKKRSPKTELLLQIINRRFRQLLPNSLLAIPQAQTALYEQARDYWPLHSEEFQRLESEISKLKSWVFEPGEEKHFEEFASSLIGLFFDYGFPCSEILETLRNIQSRRRIGSPPKWNLVAVEAEALHRQTGQNWLEITRKVCPCGKKSHNQRCRDNIIWPRVKKLRQVLEQLRLPGPKGVFESSFPAAAAAKTEDSTD